MDVDRDAFRHVGITGLQGHPIPTWAAYHPAALSVQHPSGSLAVVVCVWTVLFSELHLLPGGTWGLQGSS